MWAVFVLIFTCAVHHVHSTQLCIIPNDHETTTCDLKTSFCEACCTLQQFAASSSNESFRENITLIFAPGKHHIVGGVQLNNTTNVTIKGQIDNDKAEINCRGKNCFSFQNSSSILIEDLVFTGCSSNTSVIFASEVEAVSITGCLFINNLVRSSVIRLESIELVYLLQTQFVNNSAICNSADTLELMICTSVCLASSGAISAMDISDLQIDDSLFEGNTASCSGGAIALLLSNATILHSKFINNRLAATTGKGGGLYSDSCHLHIAGSIFEDNCAGNCGSRIIFLESTSFQSKEAELSTGGGVYLFKTDLRITNTIFTKNLADFGGALAVNNSSDKKTFISNSTFLGNFNPSVNGSGGAIFLQQRQSSCTVLFNATTNTSTNTKPVMSVHASHFKFNSGGKTGGAIATTYGAVDIAGCYFIENTAQSGGAVAAVSSAIYYQDNTFNGNKATLNGGALFCNNGSVLCINNTFSNNGQPVDGGAIYVSYSRLTSVNNVYIANEATMRGGAVSAWFSDVFITMCAFLSNNATQGGAVLVSDGKVFSSETLYEANSVIEGGGGLLILRSPTIIKGDSFQSNTAMPGVGAALLLNNNTIQLHSSVFVENRAYRKDINSMILFINVHGICSNLTFSSNNGSMFLLYSLLNFTGSVFFTNNSGELGAAFSLVQSRILFLSTSRVNLRDNTALLGGGIYLTDSELKIFTSFLKIEENIATISGGGIFGYKSQIFVNVDTTANPVLFSGNKAAEEGGALIATGTTFSIFQGFVLFSGNTAKKGGAIVLSDGSKIYIHKTIQELFDQLAINMTFFNNTAEETGGAIHVVDTTNSGTLCETFAKTSVRSFIAEECFLQTIQLYYPTERASQFINYMNVFFSANKAIGRGNDIFGGLLDRCLLHGFSEIRDFFMDENAPTGFSALKMIARFEIDIDYNKLLHPFDPHLITSSITRDHVRELISSEAVRFCFCVNNTHNCSYQWPTIFVKQGHTFTITAVIVDQVENAVEGTVLVNVISNGSRLRLSQSQKVNGGVCSELQYSISLSEPSATIELYPDGPCDNMGISSKKLELSFLPCDCPNELRQASANDVCMCECDPSEVDWSCRLDNGVIIVEKKVGEFWIQYLENSSENTSGFFNQTCPYDYCVNTPINLSLPLGVDEQCAENRSGTLCGKCDEGFSLVFGSSRCVKCSNNYLTLVMAVLLAGIFFVACILLFNVTVAVGTTYGVVLYTSIMIENSTVFLIPAIPILSWVNLNSGFETCFYNGMDVYGKLLLQLVIPVYILLLSILVLILSSYWGWFGRLIGRKNPVATLSTLFFLSFSSLIHSTIEYLQFIRLFYPNGTVEILWLYDPNIQYFDATRAPFFIISIIIIVLSTWYILQLSFEYWMSKIVESLKIPKCIKSSYHFALIDSYRAPFVLKHRYWAGLLLFTLLIHQLASAFIRAAGHLFVTAILTCLLLVLKLAIGKVYKNWLVSLLETSYLTNLLLLSVGTLYIRDAGGNQVALGIVSVSIAQITFVGIILYHIHEYFLKDFKIYRKLIKAVKKCCHLSALRRRNLKIKINSPIDLNEENRTKLKMPVHELREPALEAIIPISTEDYRELVQPPAVPPSKPARSPTTTTVIIEDSL